MKAISLTQPWAWVICHLGKRVENRSRNLGNYRGPVLLHASKGMTTADWYDARLFVEKRFGEEMAAKIPQPFLLPRGGVVGVARIVNQCGPGSVWSDDPDDGFRSEPAGWRGDQERWYMGEHAYVLEGVAELRQPIPCKGALGLWNPSPDLVALVERNVGAP